MLAVANPINTFLQQSLEESLNSINTSVETVHEQFIQIASATEEQSATCQHITENMQRIADSTNETNTRLNSSMDITRAIEDVALSMNDKVSHFRL